MELTLRFLLFLRKLLSFFRKRWDQSARRLWCIFAFMRSRILSQRPKKRDEIRRSTEHRPVKSPTAVVCASRFPPPLTPIAGGDVPITSPTHLSVRRPTIPIPGDAAYESNENSSLFGVDGYFLEGSGPITRSPDSPTSHHEPEAIHTVLPLRQEDHDHHSPVFPPRPISQYSGRSGSQHSVYRPQSQYSIHPPSHYSNRSHLNGAEAAARGYLDAPPPPRPSSPAPSVRSGSLTGSVASRVYYASRPTTRVRRPSAMRNMSRRGVRSPTPASARSSVHDVLPEPPQPEPRTSESIRGDRPSTVVSFVPLMPTPPKDRLRPMIGIDRYEKHKMVVIEDTIHSHVSPPVTTEFVR